MSRFLAWDEMQQEFVEMSEFMIPKEASMTGLQTSIRLHHDPLSDSIRQKKWDQRFLQLARHMATWSKDPSTKCGAVITRPDRTIVAVGYNGFPRGVDDDPDLLCERPEKYARTVHAEMNAILSARESLIGYTLYSWPLVTCERCAAHIIQTGISRVVWPEQPGDDTTERWSESARRSLDMYHQAGIELTVAEAPSE